MRPLAALLTALALLAGCADGAADTVAPQPTSAVPDVARRYVEAYAARRLDALGAMTELAAPSSPAAAYAAVQRGLGQAGVDSGVPPPDPYRLEPLTDEIRVCASGDVIQPCFTFGGFEVDGERLVRFTLDGLPIDDLVRAAPRGVDVPGARVEVLGSYRSVQSGLLVIPVAVTASSDGVRVAPERAVHVDPDGRRQQTFEYAAVEAPLAPGVPQTVYLAFSDAQLGGGLDLPVAGPAGEAVAQVDLE